MAKNEVLKIQKSQLLVYIYDALPIPFKALMKKPSLSLGIFLLICSGAFAQGGVIKIQSCNNSFIQHQVDSLKVFYNKDGFVLLKEASVAMESEYELPVIVPLTEGSWYQFVFIGDYSSKLYEVRMYDWEEKMVVCQKN